MDVEVVLRRFLWLFPLALYTIGAARSPGWIDATLIANNVDKLVLSSWVNSHNLFHVIGFVWSRLLFFFDLHFALTLLAGVFGAMTVHVVYLFLRDFGVGRLAAVIAAAGLMVSHGLWWHSSMLEVYTLNTFLIVLMLYRVLCFLKRPRPWRLYVAAAVFGLGCSNHVLVGLYLPAWIAFFVAMRVSRRYRPYAKPRFWLVAFAFSILGGGLYAAILFRDLIGATMAYGIDGLDRALHRVMDGATGAGFREYMFPSLPPAESWFWRKNYLVLLVANFPSVMLPAGIYGLYKLARRDGVVAGFFLFGLLAQAVWSANYWIWDMYAFAMPVYLMFALAAGVGFDAWLAPRVAAANYPGTGASSKTHAKTRYRRPAETRSDDAGGMRTATTKPPPLRPRSTAIVFTAAATIALAPVLYASLPSLYRSWRPAEVYFHSYEEVPRVLDTWQPVRYITVPFKATFVETSKHADAVLDVLPEDAVYVTDDGRDDYLLRLYYQEVLGRREDIDYISTFSPFYNHERARRTMRRVNRALQQDKEVFTVSDKYPHDLWIAQGNFSLSEVPLANGGHIFRVRAAP